MNLPSGLNQAAVTFARIITAPHPEWLHAISLYSPISPEDSTEPGSLWFETSFINAIVQSNEALVCLGDKEQLFTWKDNEVHEALIEVADYIDRLMADTTKS